MKPPPTTKPKPSPKRRRVRKQDQREEKPITAQPTGRPIVGMGGWTGGYRRSSREK